MVLNAMVLMHSRSAIVDTIDWCCMVNENCANIVVLLACAACVLLRGGSGILGCC